MTGREFADGELVPGTRYQVLSQIGAGGMGSVYVVEHTELGKRFVLKALLRELARRKDLVARLRQEWRALARLNHPNIINVTDAGTSANGVPFYVMEFLDGETLGARLKNVHRLPLVDALTIAAGVLEGLAAAHAIGIVHRDVKPPNIFLVGATGVKLLDFGIAKIAHSSAEVITARGVAIGTPRYMSPEQARGDSVDGRADLYASGLILYEMIVGRGPFDDAKDANELLLAHLGTPAPRLASLLPGVAPELDAALAQLLEKDPARRPSSARQVAASLKALAQRAHGVSTNAPTPVVRYAAPTPTHVDSSISNVPTNRMQEKTLVPEGEHTVADAISTGTTQMETPRVGTPDEARADAASEAQRISAPIVSVGSAPKSAELDATVAAPPPSGALGDTLHSPHSQQHSGFGTPASSGRNRTLRIDELVPLPPDGGQETHTAVPVVPGGETPPPVESNPAEPRVASGAGFPIWIPLAGAGLVITALVAVATWFALGSTSAEPASTVAAPAEPPPAPTPAASVAPEEEAEPVPEPEPSAAPGPPPKEPASEPEKPAKADPEPVAKKPAAPAKPAQKPAEPTPSPAKPAPPPPAQPPKLTLPGSGL